MLTRIRVSGLLMLTSAVSLFGADFTMKVSDKNYLDTQGFSVFLYDSTYHPVFVDQKNTAMEMILHGQRIASNGDVRLMSTPEQWDLVATLKERHVDKANQRLTADLAFPTFDVSYTLEVAAEPGGVRVSINLDKPLPDKLAGRAGFNLEFLPSIYMGKAYLVDGTKAGIFPRTPNDPMIKVLPLAGEPKKAYYLEDWDKAKGYTQPLPFAQGKSITLGVDDALARVNVESDTADLMLFDGRDRAQNGWFVLRSLIASGKTTGAVVWHIRPDVIPNWTRPPMIAHSQVGYAPGFSKIAVQVYPGFLYDSGIASNGPVPGLLELHSAGIFGPYTTATEIDVDKEALHASDPLVEPASTNLSTFSGNSGKLLFFHGDSDPWFSALDTLDYYKSLAATNGGADKVAEWSRIFLVPGMAHCAGGPALDRFDMLSAVVNWVEKGTAPDAVVATGKAFPGRSRPLCAYPKHAQYKGTGDTEDARNFTCQ